MNLAVRLSGERSFALRHAILVYSDGRRGFATLHDPVQVDGQAPQLGPGRTVGSAFLKELTGQLGESVSADVLPRSVLVRTSDITVWWRRASTAALFYHPSEAKNKG